MGNLFYFAKGHATDMLTTFYNREYIHRLVEIVDWRSVKTSYWVGRKIWTLKEKSRQNSWLQMMFTLAVLLASVAITIMPGNN